jgi:hypothetical protein
LKERRNCHTFDSPEARANFKTRHIRNLSERKRRRAELIEEFSNETIVDMFPGRVELENSPRVVNTIHTDTSTLSKFATEKDRGEWDLVFSGYWSEGIYHGGYISYHIRKVTDTTWLLRSEQRNDCLDNVEQEDVDEGRLDHNQFCAMNGMTLDEAQDQRYLDLVAVYLYASTALSNTVAASRLYEGLRAAGGLIIDESDEVEGLLSP